MIITKEEKKGFMNMKKKSRDRRVLGRLLKSATTISYGEMEVFNGRPIQWIITKPHVHATYHYDKNGNETIIE